MASLLGPAPLTTPRYNRQTTHASRASESSLTCASIRESARPRTHTVTHKQMRRHVHGDPALRSKMNGKPTINHHRERGVVTEEVVGRRR
jgi:hypothetical protein